MCTVPPQIQAQISEAISLIAKVDYPHNWDNLLPELVQQFGSSDPAVVNGVLKTADGIFKRFRYVGRSDALYTIIKYTLERIQAPLLTLFVEIGKAVDALSNDPAQLVPRLESLRIMNRIFYSLNYQDLPEFFEDHIQEWMGQFSKYLQYSNPCVTDESEEIEPGPIDKLQAAIIQNLDLYASKDEEVFLPFLPDFTTLIWNRLLTVTSYPKHDNLATTSIRFLSSLVSKLMHKALFQDEATLREIVLKIVIPNLMFREVRLVFCFVLYFLLFSCFSTAETHSHAFSQLSRAMRSCLRTIPGNLSSQKLRAVTADPGDAAARIFFEPCADNSSPRQRQFAQSTLA